ncbi:hypothetical protein BUALT_Bualt06G0083800 [Buddleja alternifolia]|uniref:Uncharacterized protein n=1 Tax=Buddleja alternifolia TaxID=168488 RepID=A0AAV6XPH7_9LAMI|nr:hypothetical protein BUALT_Bualt06G0083800 [Buddleja alternifolia]
MFISSSINFAGCAVSLMSQILRGSPAIVMDADAKDIQSDLYALKKLYGLLRKDGDETSNTTSDLLDEHARLLLKNLLDAAAKRTLKLHAEMIVGQVEASDMLSPPAQLQSPDLSFNETQLSQSCKKDLEDSDKDKKLDRLDITLWKENKFNPQGSRAGAVEQSEQSVVGNGPEYKNKLCRVCRRNTLKHLDSIDDTNFYDVGTQNSNSFFDQNNESGHYPWKSEQEIRSNNADESKSEKGRQTRPSPSNSSGTAYTDFSSDRMVSDFDKVCNYDIETTNKPDEVDRASEDASEVLKQIELCISAFQIGADHLHLFESNSARHQNSVVETKSVSPALQTQYGAVSRTEMSQSESSFQDRVGYLQHQVPCPTTEEINLPSFSSSQPSKMVQPSNGIWRQSAYHFIRNRSPALESDALGELGQSIEEHEFPVYKANKFHGQNVKAITDKIDSGNCIMSRNGTSSETPSWPVIIDSASRMESPYQRRGVIKDENNKHIQSRPSDSLMYLNNSENAHSVDSGLNVALTSGVRCKKHPSKMMEETLLHRKPSQLFVTPKNKGGIPTNRQHYMTATEKLIQHQESEGTPTDSYSSNLRSQQTGSGDSDSKDYSSPDRTRKLRYVSSSRSSESWASPLSQGSESSYTSNSADEVYSSTSGESTPNGSSSSSYHQPIQRRAGPHTFRGSPRQGNQMKYKGKNIHFKKEDEAYGERAVEKARKSLIHDKNQKVHFHGLMEGLLRHVCRSKKSKAGKETVGQLTKGQHRKKKTLKKSQWWQLLQHHRGARKTQVKLGMGKKRTRLKALPMLK